MAKAGEQVRGVCRLVGMSRQGHYQGRRQRQLRTVAQAVVLQLVDEQRREHPRMGCRKLMMVTKDQLREAGIEIGRDRMFRVLREGERLVKRYPRTKRTTQSRHSLPVFRNEIRDRVLTGPNQVWVVDLTYVRIKTGFVFLALVMDAWSRKIVGHYVGETLESIGCQRALEEALSGLDETDERPTHHSDQGCQYACHAYVAILMEAGCQISMTEEMHCYENGKAERVIGTLKWEYGIEACFETAEDARKAIKQGIRAYNEGRPHNAIGGRKPSELHEEGRKKRAK